MEVVLVGCEEGHSLYDIAWMRNYVHRPPNKKKQRQELKKERECPWVTCQQRNTKRATL